MSTIATSTGHSLMMVPEVTYGVVPTDPAFKEKLIKGTTLGLNKSLIESALITPNRQVRSVRGGNRQIGGEITSEFVAENFDDAFEALFGNQWNADELVPSTDRKSFTIVRIHDIAGAGTNYPVQIYKGCEFNTLDLSAKPDDIVQVSFGMFAKEMVLANDTSAIIGDGSVTGVTANESVDSFTGSILIDGVAMDVTEFSFKIDNGTEPRWRLFSDTTLQPKRGKFRVTGSLSVYFKNSALLAKFNASDKFTLALTLITKEGHEYLFTLDNCLPTGGQTDVEGEADVIIPVPFTTEAPGPSDNTLAITRTLVEE